MTRCGRDGRWVTRVLGWRVGDSGCQGWQVGDSGWRAGDRVPGTQLCPSHPGPALVHPECAQAGERPALLPTLQRQPAPRHREALGGAAGARRTDAAAATAPAHLPPGDSGTVVATPWILTSSTLLHAPPAPRTVLRGCLSTHWGAQGVWGRRRVVWPGTREAPASPVGGMCKSFVCQSRDKCQGQLVTVPPSHHSTPTPIPALLAEEKREVGTVWLFCQAPPPQSP